MATSFHYLIEIAKRQVTYLTRFGIENLIVESIQLGLRSGAFHVSKRNGHCPSTKKQKKYGWIKNKPQGPWIGFAEKGILFIPADTKVSLLVEPLPKKTQKLFRLSRTTFWKDLNAFGMLAERESARRRLTVRKNFGGKSAYFYALIIKL